MNRNLRPVAVAMVGGWEEGMVVGTVVAKVVATVEGWGEEGREEAMVEERAEAMAEGWGMAVGTEKVEAAMGKEVVAMEMEMEEVARTLEEETREVEAGAMRRQAAVLGNTQQERACSRSLIQEQVHRRAGRMGSCCLTCRQNQGSG